MSTQSPTLHMLCGKIASGKSTLAAHLAREDATVVVAEDEWLHSLYADELSSIADYARCTSKLRSVMGPHIAALLNAGVSVVMDFQANTVEARAWMRNIVDKTHAAHVLHVLDIPDEVCLERLRARNARGDHPFAVTEEQFRQFSSHFVAPSPDEGFNLVIHDGSEGD